jgi:hypothetical protein
MGDLSDSQLPSVHWGFFILQIPGIVSEGGGGFIPRNKPFRSRAFRPGGLFPGIPATKLDFFTKLYSQQAKAVAERLGDLSFLENCN